MAEPGDRGRHRRGSRWWQRGPYWSSHRRSDLPERPPDRVSDRAADHMAEWTQDRPSDRSAERSQGRRAQWEAQWGADWPGWPPEQPVDRVYTVTAPVVDDRPHYIWQDFELDDLPTRAAPHSPDAPDLRDGRRHCGPLERILHREWDAAEGPPSADAVRAVDSLASLPEQLKTKLAIGLEGIYVGRGGVPDLDDMGYLRGAPLPSGRATWDICAGAYGDRKIVVGDRPSPTPDVMMHEVGHALDDVDAGPGEWVSDSPEFAALYEECLPLFASSFHRQPGGLGRKEFFADAFAAIASRQRPALVDMLGGDTRTALNVMLFFNRRYGI
ncbi:hypothetical protein SAMN05421833_12631 [Microbispora rosea]|uniref:Uncharacterized protein n=1 Tax=Microbispora rosea TaxID=58117 RepID=A0A1N7G509_9ACTN|nr:hypothetical protein Mro03_13680 [Microbispora rosea subsp. rosea]SIS07652.1 hypothetical protein SAMN05421833_12631 [Microbispora rosea]